MVILYHYTEQKKRRYKRIADTSRIHHQHVRYLILIRSEQETKTHRKKGISHNRMKWRTEPTENRVNRKPKKKTHTTGMNKISDTLCPEYDSLRCDLLFVSKGK